MSTGISTSESLADADSGWQALLVPPTEAKAFQFKMDDADVVTVYESQAAGHSESEVACVVKFKSSCEADTSRLANHWQCMCIDFKLKVQH